ncbi:hypothetical protein ACOME3_010725 [Neoechinorhynchus agilis]
MQILWQRTFGGKSCFARKVKCGKMGYFARCCSPRSRVNLIQNISDRESMKGEELIYNKDEDELERHIYNIPGGKRAEIPVVIEGVRIRMEFDTGAAESIITRALWHRIGRVKLRATNELRAFGETRLRILEDAQ